MILEQGIGRALTMLYEASKRDNYIGPSGYGTATAEEVWIGVGLGYCTAKGYATYSGGGQFKITPSGLIEYTRRKGEGLL